MLAAVLAAVRLAVRALPAHGQPTPFGPNKGIEYLFMAVLGGVGHVWGAFVGSTVVKLVGRPAAGAGRPG